MKNIVLVACVCAFISCVKNPVIPPDDQNNSNTDGITLKVVPSITLATQTGKNRLIALFVVQTKNFVYNKITGCDLIVTDTTKIHNPHLTIRDSSFFSSGTLQWFYSNSFALQLDPNRSDTLRVYADIDDGATNFSVNEFHLYYNWPGTGLPYDVATPAIAGGPVTVTQGPKLSITATATTYSPDLRTTSMQKIDPFQIHLQAMGKFTVTSVVIKNVTVISGASAQVEIYNGATSIGSGTLSGDSVVIPCTLALSGTTDLDVKITFSASPATLDKNRKVIIGSVGYKDESGTQFTQDLSVESGDIYVTKALLRFAQNVISNPAKNDVQQVLHSMTVTSDPNGEAGALKQHTYRLTFLDGGILTNPWLDSVYVTINGVAGLVTLSNINGTVINTLTKNDTIVYATMANGKELLVNTAQKIELHGIPRNYSEGLDAVFIEIASDKGAPYGHYLASFGVNGGYYAAALAPQQSTMGIPSYTIVSDRSGTPHSALPGNPTPDWTSQVLDDSFIQIVQPQ